MYLANFTTTANDSELRRHTGFSGANPKCHRFLSVIFHHRDRSLRFVVVVLSFPGPPSGAQKGNIGGIPAGRGHDRAGGRAGKTAYTGNPKRGIRSPFTILAIDIFAVAFVEEFFKYAAVWFKEQAINHNYQLDEPADFVIYMVVSALGFAAVENLLFLLMPDTSPLIARSLVRAGTAILLHTLTSGMLGYYMAMTFCHRERRTSILVSGFVIVSCLHGLYNFSIMKSETNLEFLLATLSILLFMACTLYIQFQHLLRMKSVCDMKSRPKRK